MNSAFTTFPFPKPYVATHNVVHNVVQLQLQLRYSYSSNLTYVIAKL